MTADEILAIVQRRDPDEMASAILALWGKMTFDAKVPKKVRTKVAKAAEHPPKETWLTPSIEAWEKVMGLGSAQPGWMGKYLSPLREHYEDAEIGQRLAMYLLVLKANDELKFASVKRFSETIGQFSPTELAFPDESAP